MPYSCKIAQVLILHALGHVKGEYRKHTDAPLQSNDHEERTIMGTTMSKQFSNAQRAAAGQAILQMDLYWAEAFAETGMSDLNYCDLFTHLWLIREQEALPKTALYPLMPNISRRTAVKYVQQAVESGMLMEEDCSSDKRIRLIRLTSKAIALVEAFLDHTCTSFRGVGSEQ